MEQRKKLRAAYQNRKQTGGIFQLRNQETGKVFLQSSTDLMGSQNRFVFSQQTDSCLFGKLAQDWKLYGGNSFVFEILEELEKIETQTSKEFRQDISTLEELWREKLNDQPQY